ncbi:MAG: hypothetical protein ACR2M3_10935 [Thermomicrobiales bacterium]
MRIQQRLSRRTVLCGLVAGAFACALPVGAAIPNAGQYTDPNGRFQIGVPPNWVVHYSATTPDVTRWEVPGVAGSFSVYRSDLPANVWLGAFADTWIATFVAIRPGYRQIERTIQSTQCGAYFVGCQGQWAVLDYTTDDGGPGDPALRGRIAFLASDSNVWMLELALDPVAFPQYLDTFDTILNSFTLT